MKRIFAFAVLALLMTSCAQKIPYTDQVKQDFDLTPENMTKVQFYTSSNIILEKNQSSGNQGTGSSGELVVSSSKTQNRVIIPSNTRGVFEKVGPNNEVVVRFEIGSGKVVKFATRATQTSGKYYLVADWKSNGGTLEYGNEMYTVASGGSSAFLQVRLKKMQRTKRKDRVVKGMKV
ncbi:hypothetical protein [Fluviicola sp.]|jgi:hypothetical protein|uniref:hypothetical protein n=1 Tax=Fluviicola sp. TaxID=1917219 RepID=UPI0028321FCD|nr:hypothetical protein [Fluviicola sp.]MDR0802206.1 hypothetical protein [Fluviicola sp.]